jgi:hypothetical protein
VGRVRWSVGSDGEYNNCITSSQFGKDGCLEGANSIHGKKIKEDFELYT